MTASTEYYIQFVSVVARGDGLGVSVVAGGDEEKGWKYVFRPQSIS